MKLFRAKAMILILAAFHGAHAQNPVDESDAIRRATALKVHGDFAGAIAILAPIAASPSTGLSDEMKGVVWSLLGSTYQISDNFGRAQYCYERAITVLQQLPSAQTELASAINGLGSLEETLGQSTESERLRKRAEKIYEMLDDHAGMARISTSLAIIALRNNDRSAARAYLARALQESRLAHGLEEDDFASMSSVQGWLALNEKKPQLALSFFEDAIAHWTRRHGANSCQVATGMVLRAEAREGNGDFTDASTDIQQAENIFLNVLGRNSTLYWNTVLQEAALLKREGRRRDSWLLEKSATSALGNIERQGCVNCTITAEAFR
jgi:tetratricopeptide (TPR) repeat protein